MLVGNLSYPVMGIVGTATGALEAPPTWEYCGYYDSCPANVTPAKSAARSIDGLEVSGLALSIETDTGTGVSSGARTRLMPFTQQQASAERTFA